SHGRTVPAASYAERKDGEIRAEPQRLPLGGPGCPGGWICPEQGRAPPIRGPNGAWAKNRLYLRALPRYLAPVGRGAFNLRTPPLASFAARQPAATRMTCRWCPARENLPMPCRASGQS